jgi:hypothetical protein
MACLTAHQNYPLVNDNVTISGHAQRLSEKIRSRYQNRPNKTPIKTNTQVHPIPIMVVYQQCKNKEQQHKHQQHQEA